MFIKKDISCDEDIDEDTREPPDVDDYQNKHPVFLWPQQSDSTDERTVLEYQPANQADSERVGRCEILIFPQQNYSPLGIWALDHVLTGENLFYDRSSFGPTTN